METTAARPSRRRSSCRSRSRERSRAAPSSSCKAPPSWHPCPPGHGSWTGRQNGSSFQGGSAAHLGIRKPNTSQGSIHLTAGLQERKGNRMGKLQDGRCSQARFGPAPPCAKCWQHTAGTMCYHALRCWQWPSTGALPRIPRGASHVSSGTIWLNTFLRERRHEPADVADRFSCSGDTIGPHSKPCRVLPAKCGRADTSRSPSTCCSRIQWPSTRHPDSLHALATDPNRAEPSLHKLGTKFYCSRRCLGLPTTCDLCGTATPQVPSCPHRYLQGKGHRVKLHAAASPSTRASCEFALSGSTLGTSLPCEERCVLRPPRCVPACTSKAPSFSIYCICSLTDTGHLANSRDLATAARGIRRLFKAHSGHQLFLFSTSFDLASHVCPCWHCHETFVIRFLYSIAKHLPPRAAA